MGGGGDGWWRWVTMMIVTGMDGDGLWGWVVEIGCGDGWWRWMVEMGILTVIVAKMSCGDGWGGNSDGWLWW